MASGLRRASMGPPPMRKRGLPALEVRAPPDGPPFAGGSSDGDGAALRWETGLRLDNTPKKGVLSSIQRPPDVDQRLPSPSEAVLRLRLATPKAKAGALAPLQPLALAPSGGQSKQVSGVVAPSVLYNKRALKVQALETRLPEQGG